MGRVPRSSSARLVLGVGALLAVATLVRAWGDTLDDAFITFRVVHNAVRGEGITFNPGSPPVECFSNPLLAFLLVPFAALGVSLPLTARLFGLFGVALALQGVHRLARHAALSEHGHAVALGTTLGSTALLYYAATGLETAFLSGLLLSAIARTVEQRGLDPSATFLWTLVALSRPEAPLVVALTLAATLPRERRSIWAAAPIAVALVALELARIAYYGDIVPNTFHAKLPGTADHDPTSSGLLAGPSYLAHFALACGLVLPLGATLAVRELRSSSGPRREVLVATLSALAAGVIFALYAGGDWMPMGRYLVPYVPLVGLAGVLGLEALARRGVLKQPLLALGVAAGASYLGSTDALSELWLHAREYPYHVMGSRDSIAAIEGMRAHIPSGARVVAFRIGALGDVGGYQVIDLLGLADRDIAAIIARNPGYHPQRSRMGEDVPALRDHVRGLSPDAVLLVTYADGALDERLELYGLPWRFAEAYPIGIDQRWALYVRAR